MTEKSQYGWGPVSQGSPLVAICTMESATAIRSSVIPKEAAEYLLSLDQRQFSLGSPRSSEAVRFHSGPSSRATEFDLLELQ
ncbi:hypothetical protein E4U30_005333 [Claviceps sp. LM220 group G6]|nr:hypothetical protein E4U30_005333 [Claviceps sp. LM220 group G6]